jgi:hypothetical protein
MLIQNNGHTIFLKNNNNSKGIRNFKLPISTFNIQSRNNNNILIKEKNIRKNSLYSTKEATPRKEYSKVVLPTTLQNTFIQKTKEKKDNNELDDSLSQISQILNKRDLNYSGLAGKIPGISEEANFVYDQIVFNKSRINKAKILSHKIGVLKLPISKISSIEALTNSDRGRECFSDRVQGVNNMNRNGKIENSVDVSCCFFGKK